MPNVICKISGVTTEADHKNWTREQLKPYIAHAIESFGFDRVDVWRRLACARSSPAPIRNGSRSSTGWSRAHAGGEAQALPRQRHRLLSPRPLRLPAWMRQACRRRALQHRRRCARLARAACRGRSSISPMAAAEDERTLRRNEGRLRRDRSCCRARCAVAATRDLSVELFGQAAQHAGDRRADRPLRPVLAGRRALQPRAPRPPPAPPSASAMARSARSRSWPRPAPRRAGCRSSSTGTAASPASWPSARKATGYDALVLTIDNQLLGNRERDIRNGFTIPPRSGRSAARARWRSRREWLWRMRKRAQAHHIRQLRAAGRGRRSQPRSPAAWPRCSIPRCHGAMSTSCARSGPARSSSKACCIPHEARKAASTTASTG